MRRTARWGKAVGGSPWSKDVDDDHDRRAVVIAGGEKDVEDDLGGRRRNRRRGDGLAPSRRRADRVREDGLAPGRRRKASRPAPSPLRRRPSERERARPRFSCPTSRLGEPYPGERSRMGRNFLASRTAKWTRRAPRARFARGLSTRGKCRDPGLFPGYQMSPDRSGPQLS